MGLILNGAINFFKKRKTRFQEVLSDDGFFQLGRPINSQKMGFM